LQNQVTDSVTGSLSGGYAERNPTLTELYAAQPFLLVLQNGLNNVTGDPELSKERLFQIDFGLEYQSETIRTGWRGFYSWAWDYVTYENTRVLYTPPDGDVGQVSLRYINTDLATFIGTEWFGEFMPNSPLTPFASLRVVDGRDRTRNGDFATSNGNALISSEKVSGLPRGFFSGIAGSDEEPLPQIPPLEGRIGWRIHDTSPERRWNIEVGGRLVNQQQRIATSLLETRTPGFSVWDTRSVFRVPRVPGMVIALGVENMFDRRYREHFDFRNQNGLSIFQPGANFYVGTSVTY
jgi:outer membrane receptor for ferrienterochelin and colicin